MMMTTDKILTKIHKNAFKTIFKLAKHRKLQLFGIANRYTTKDGSSLLEKDIAFKLINKYQNVKKQLEKPNLSIIDRKRIKVKLANMENPKCTKCIRLKPVCGESLESLEIQITLRGKYPCCLLEIFQDSKRIFVDTIINYDLVELLYYSNFLLWYAEQTDQYSFAVSILCWLIGTATYYKNKKAKGNLFLEDFKKLVKQHDVKTIRRCHQTKH